MIRIAIAGAGGFGLEALQIVKDIGGYDVVGFLTPDPEGRGVALDNLPVLGGDERLRTLIAEGVSAIVVAIGQCGVRQRLSHLALELGYALPTIVHPKSYVAPAVTVGVGAIVYPGAIIMPGCSLSEGVLVNAGVVLGHEVKVGRYSNINPGAAIAGRVSIGERVLVGIGSRILENCSIGDDAKIGAGAVVLDHIPSGATAVGVPAVLTGKQG